MIKLESGVSSLITLEVLGDNGDVRRSLQFCNVMTNYGLDSWAKGILGVHIAIGSGSRTELPSVTDLSGFVRSASGTYGYVNTDFIDSPSGVMRSDNILTVTFPVETVAQNYSEMGIHNNNPNALQTYARIRDADGEPTSVSVQVGEQLRVSYVVQFSTPLLRTTTQTIGTALTTITTVPLATGGSNAVRLPSVGYSYMQFYPAGQEIPVAGLAPVGGVISPRSATISNGLYLVTLQLADVNLAGGISLVRLGGDRNSIGVMCHFDPPIGKNDGLTMTLRISTSLVNGAYYA